MVIAPKIAQYNHGRYSGEGRRTPILLYLDMEVWAVSRSSRCLPGPSPKSLGTDLLDTGDTNIDGCVCSPGAGCSAPIRHCSVD